MNFLKKLADLEEKYPMLQFMGQCDDLFTFDPMKYYIYDDNYDEGPDYLTLALTIGHLPDEEHADKLKELSDEQLVGGIVRLGKKFKANFPDAQFDVRDNAEMYAKVLIIKVPNVHPHYAKTLPSQPNYE
jgi:hypothetical protein